MPETLITRFSAQFITQLTNTLALFNGNANPGLSVTMNMTSGTNDNQANQVWEDQRVLLPSTSENISVLNFNGSLDGVGQALSLARVKALFIQNVGAQNINVEAGSLTVGGAGAGAWNVPFNGNGSSKMTIPGGASFIAIAPLANGWPVGSSSGTLLNIANLSSAGTILYNVLVIGANG